MSDTVGSIANGVSNTKETFSSWDKCMQKTYCKWPVIVVIVVGSLIALSVIFCVARCLCCGAECACCCFRCCVGCCGSGRRKGAGHKRMNSAPTANAFNAPYRSQPAPVYAPTPAHSPYAQNHTTYEQPQFARFETPSKPVNEDALPAMPSWSDAKSTRVEDNSPVEDVEMKPLSPSGEKLSAAAPAAAPMGRSPVYTPQGDVDAYGYPAQPERNNSYNSAGGYHTGPYRSDNSFRGQRPPQQQGYKSGTQSPYSRSQTPSYNDGYQESGVYHNQGQQNSGYGQQSQRKEYEAYNGGYNSRNNGYNADPYARQASPNYSNTTRPEQSTTPYPQDDHYGGGYQTPQQSAWHPQPVQQQGGWQTRKPVDGTWKEI